MRRGIATLAWLYLLCGIASAQTLGEITGDVADPSGAAVPQAVVSVTNMETNLARQTTTNASGLYTFPDLVPGTYSVKVTASGFDTTVKSNIVLEVQQTARIDFALQVGHSTQTVEVAANAAALSTETATVGTVVEEKRIMDLPLNGRSYFSLVSLSSGVTTGFVPAAQAAGRLGGTRAALTIAVTGGRSTWENYTLDGVTNTDIDFNTYILQPSVDALQEFKVQVFIRQSSAANWVRLTQPPSRAPTSSTARCGSFSAMMFWTASPMTSLPQPGAPPTHLRSRLPTGRISMVTN